MDLRRVNRVLRRALILVLLLGALTLRVYQLGEHELRGDEAFGYFFTQQSFSQIVTATLTLREPHPVASYFLQHVWLTLSGDSEFALRFASAWWSVLAVALLYCLGRQLAPVASLALIATAILACNPAAIWHSHDYRMYSMSLALTTGSVVLAWRLLVERTAVPATDIRSIRWWVLPLAYAIVAALALQTHYYAVFVLVALNLYALGMIGWSLGHEHSADLFMLWRWLAAQVLLAAAVMPWLVVARTTLIGYGGNGDSPAFIAMLERSLSAFSAGELAASPLRTALACIVAVLLVSGFCRLVAAGSKGRRAASLLFLYLAIPVLATWVSAQSRPIFNERYLVAALPPFCLLLAAAWPVTGWRGTTSKVLADRAIGLLFLGVLTTALIGLGRYYTSLPHSPGWRQLAAAFTRVAGDLSPAEVMLVENYPDPTLWYYYRGLLPHMVLPPGARDAAGSSREVQTLVEKGVRWVMLPLQPSSAWDPAGMADAALTASYSRVAELSIHPSHGEAAGWPLRVYVRPPALLGPVDVAFNAPPVRMLGAEVEPSRMISGGVAVVHLDWQVTGGSWRGSEKLTLQLLDATGRLVAQTDVPFTAAVGAGIATYGILIPAGLQPGVHTVIVGLYDGGQSGSPRLPAVDGRTAVTLAQVTIE